MTALALQPSRRRSKLGRRVRIAAGIVACIVFLFPVFWMVLSSFKDQRDIFTTPPTLFFTPTLETYIGYMQRADINRRLINTIIVATGSGLLSIVAGAMAGYALARIKLRQGPEGQEMCDDPRDGLGYGRTSRYVDQRPLGDQLSAH